MVGKVSHELSDWQKIVRSMTGGKQSSVNFADQHPAVSWLWIVNRRLPAEVSHKVCDWRNYFLVFPEGAPRVVVSERKSAAMSFLSPYGTTQVKVSHERIDWRIF